MMYGTVVLVSVSFFMLDFVPLDWLGIASSNFVG